MHRGIMVRLFAAAVLSLNVRISAQETFEAAAIKKSQSRGCHRGCTGRVSTRQQVVGATCNVVDDSAQRV
jgi:hypothetical protein